MATWTRETNGDEVVEAFPDQVKGKTILITGPGIGGIGAETAISLATASPKLIILAGRTKSKIDPVIETIRTTSPSVEVVFIPLDLASQKSVRLAAKAVKAVSPNIDIFIANGAIMACPFALSEDGVESQFATNYIGHWLLVNLLLPEILATEKPRIVLVSSTAYGFSGIRWEDVNFTDAKEKGLPEYQPFLAYGQSKTALIMMARTLARKLKDKAVQSYSLHPGSIITELQVHLNAMPGGRQAAIASAKAAAEAAGKEWVPIFEKTLQQGCSSTLIAALDPRISESNGEYLLDGQVHGVRPDVGGIAEEDRLWSLTEEIVGETFTL